MVQSKERVWLYHSIGRRRGGVRAPGVQSTLMPIRLQFSGILADRLDSHEIERDRLWLSEHHPGYREKKICDKVDCGARLGAWPIWELACERTDGPELATRVLLVGTRENNAKDT
jgi:hypothetical protein